MLSQLRNLTIMEVLTRVQSIRYLLIIYDDLLLYPKYFWFGLFGFRNIETLVPFYYLLFPQVN